MKNPLANFLRLHRFDGREPRRQFWPYAGIVLVLWLFGLGPLCMYAFAGDIFTVTETTAVPVEVPEAAGELPGFLKGFFFALGLSAALLIALLAAAVARRLQDGGVRPYWGLLPVPFLVIFFGLFWTVLSTASPTGVPSLPLFIAAMLDDFAYLVSMVVVIVLLCRSTRPPQADAFD